MSRIGLTYRALPAILFWNTLGAGIRKARPARFGGLPAHAPTLPSFLTRPARTRTSLSRPLPMLRRAGHRYPPLRHRRCRRCPDDARSVGTRHHHRHRQRDRQANLRTSRRSSEASKRRPIPRRPRLPLIEGHQAKVAHDEIGSTAAIGTNSEGVSHSMRRTLDG